MTLVMFKTFTHPITGEEISFPYYPECPWARKVRNSVMDIRCTHPKKTHWNKCLAYQTLEPNTCPYEMEG